MLNGTHISKTRWMTLVMLLTLIGTTPLLSADSVQERYPSREEILTGTGSDFNYMVPKYNQTGYLKAMWSENYSPRYGG